MLTSALRLACSDPHGEFEGQNCLIERETVEGTASALGLTPDEAEQTLAKAREMLHAKRSDRPRPHVDDKVSWSLEQMPQVRRGPQALRRLDNQHDTSEQCGNGYQWR